VNVGRWCVTILLMGTILTANLWTVRCEDRSRESATVAMESDDDSMPDCCIDGMCPRHMAAMQHSKPADDSDECLCHMSSDTPRMMVLSTFHTIHPGDLDLSVDLSPTWTGLHTTSPCGVSPALQVSTPPPRA
jgi:hypothetical protein